MKNNICPECGMPRIDCGNKGIKTINEIALEKKIERLQEQMNEANELLKSLLPIDNWKQDAEVLDYLTKWGIK